MSVRAAILEALSSLDAAEHLGAVVARDDRSALLEAVKLDRAGVEPRWPAVTVKDWIDVRGLPCEGEHRTRQHRVPSADASAVARLRAAGSVIVAKTQPGSDHPLHGECRHPDDPRRLPGGSSTGEAVLVAAGASRLGLGSDSGGSIRVPAAWCGVVGFKPSLGVVPATGHYPPVGGRRDGRTVIGPIAPTVSEASAALELIAGPDGRDPDCLGLGPGAPPGSELRARAIRGRRVAVVGDEGDWSPADSTRAAVDRVVDLLERELAADVLVDPFPVHLDRSFEITQRYWGRAGYSGAEVDRQLTDWDRFAWWAQQQVRELGIDLVVGPVVADVAPPRRPMTGEDYVFTLAWSLCGWPAISLPAGVDPDNGLPVAVQIAAPRWGDELVLAVAAALEPLLV